VYQEKTNKANGFVALGSKPLYYFTTNGRQFDILIVCLPQVFSVFLGL